MDDKTRADATARLKRIAGQVAGVQRMLDEDRYCVDVLLQVSAIQGALGEVSRVVLASHVQSCVAVALRTGSVEERKTKLDELIALLSQSGVVTVNGRGQRAAARRRSAARPRRGRT
jgi:DNA-binding FrmR family transcriptional regulator